MTTVLLIMAAGLWIWAAAASNTVQPYEARLTRYAGGRAEQAKLAELRQAPWARLLGLLTRQVRRRRGSGRSRWSAEELASAGIDPARIEASRILSGMAGAALGIPLLAAAPSALAVLIAAALGLIGYILPPVVLGLRLEDRRAAIRGALPDVLDFVAVALRAGQSLDQALSMVAAETQGPLAGLIRGTQREIGFGAPRGEALRLLGERSGVAEVRELAGHLVRSLAYGASLADTFHREAQHLRAMLRARARQRSAEAAIRMLFPLVLFYIPTLFLITIGPVAVRLVGSLSGKFPH